MRLQTLKPRIAILAPRQRGVTPTTRITGTTLQRIRDRILARDAGVCRCDHCATHRELRAAHEVEHYLPLWAGGTEDDANRYAISKGCHALKNACEARMRGVGVFDLTLCTCGRHGLARASQTPPPTPSPSRPRNTEG